MRLIRTAAALVVLCLAAQGCGEATLVASLGTVRDANSHDAGDGGLGPDLAVADDGLHDGDRDGAPDADPDAAWMPDAQADWVPRDALRDDLGGNPDGAVAGDARPMRDTDVDADVGVDTDAGIEADGGIDADAGIDLDAGIDRDGTPDPDAAIDPDVFVPTPDAFVPPPDAFVPPPDAFVPPPDAFVPPPDAFVPPPDAFVTPPDAFVPPPDAAPAPLPECPAFDNARVTGNVVFPGLVEASGVVESRRNPGVLWSHNDSGDSSRVFAFDTEGQPLALYRLDGPRPSDWEDIAIGPGPEPNVSYLYLGDVGDNLMRRGNIRIRRFPEPRVERRDEPPTIDIAGVETLTLVYPDGPHNCETLMVDPRTGDVFVVTKSGDGISPIYRATAPLSPDGNIALEQVANLRFGANPLRGSSLTTGGDISPDGDEILIRTYGSAYLWRRGRNASIAEALGTPPCPVPQAGERQGEAIGFALDGAGYYTVTEGGNPPLNFYRRR